MTKHPMSSPEDPHAYRATALAARNLFRRQAITLEQAWAVLLQPEEGAEAMPAEARGPTRELLAEFGYAEHLVMRVGEDCGRLLWIRPNWLAETIEEVRLL